ncbi:MAG: lipid-A-disaccharide synthase [Thiomonas sp.]
MASGTLAFVAGESSGDLLASHVLHALHARAPDMRMAGIGGPHMQAAGFDAWWQSERLAVNGYADVLARLPELLLMRRKLRLRLTARPPAVFVGVDAPDFNLQLERRLRQVGVPVVHMVSPSIWAWRRERIDLIRQAVDHMLCVFPFEPAIYAETGVKATYIGHPLAEVIPLDPDRGAARRALGVSADAQVLAVLPGSRRAEVRHLIAPFLGAAALLVQRGLASSVVVPIAHPSLKPMVLQAAAAHPTLPLVLIDGQSHVAMAACNLAIVASGTATLECALFKRPMVIGYRMSALSWRMMSGRGYLPDVGLPNILAGTRLVPELLQHDCTPEALAQAANGLLDDAAQQRRLHDRFMEMHLSLRRDTAALAAQAILDMVAAP